MLLAQLISCLALASLLNDPNQHSIEQVLNSSLSLRAAKADVKRLVLAAERARRKEESKEEKSQRQGNAESVGSAVSSEGGGGVAGWGSSHHPNAPPLSSAALAESVERLMRDHRYAAPIKNATVKLHEAMQAHPTHVAPTSPATAAASEATAAILQPPPEQAPHTAVRAVAKTVDALAAGALLLDTSPLSPAARGFARTVSEVRACLHDERSSAS